MKFNKFYNIFSLLFLSFLASPLLVYAHEQYVLTKDQINGDIAAQGPSVWSALNNPENLKIALCVMFGTLLLFILYFLWQHSRPGQKFEKFMAKFEPFGHVLLRFALAASLILSAHFNSFLGPEIPVSSIPFSHIIKFAMYVLGAMILLGFYSELAAFLSLCILLIATWVYKSYMLSYVNYLGEFFALIYFGSRTFSIDRLIRGVKHKVEKYKQYEIALIRVTYGMSVMYPAILYKLIHPEVIIDIVNRYDLTQFHWLFPQDPLLISLGTGLAQVLVGLCIIFGFETRLNTLITFGLMMLSVMFFKEAVWPHYILLALAFYLIINNGGDLGLDAYIERRKLKSVK